MLLAVKEVEVRATKQCLRVLQNRLMLDAHMPVVSRSNRLRKSARSTHSHDSSFARLAMPLAYPDIEWKGIAAFATSFVCTFDVDS